MLEISRKSTAEQVESDSPQERIINDAYFWRELEDLKDLRDFFTREVIVIPPEKIHLLLLGDLNRLKYKDGSKYRSPTLEE